MDRRGVLRLIGGVVAAGLSGAVAACSSVSQPAPQVAVANGQTLSFGLMAPMVGPDAGVGADITKGFKLYLDDNQNLLGLYGVDLKVVDEGASVADATKAMKSLLDAGVLAIAGVASPAALSGVLPLALAAKVPLLSANAAPVNVGTIDFVWRVSSLMGEAGRSAATFARSEGRRAYVLSDGSPAAQAEVSGFTSAFTGLDGVIGGTSTGTDGLSGRISAAINAKADVIFAAHSGDSALALLNGYRASSTSIKLVGPASLTESIDLTKLDPLPEHVYTSGFYAPDLDNADNRRFVASFENAHGVPPTSVACAAYDAAGLLDRALRLVSGNPDSNKINDAMKVLGQINSARGTWTFNTNHSPQQTWYLRQLRFDGQVASNLHDSDLAVLS
jgi:branched-chain amino acid transport system substrate-binding protein